MEDKIQENALYPLGHDMEDTNKLISRTSSAVRIDITISLYFIAMILVMGALSHFYHNQMLTVSVIIILFFILLIFFILRLKNTLVLKVLVDRWMTNNAKISLALKYDLIPAQGCTSEKKAKNIIFGLYNGSEEYYKEHPDSFKLGVDKDDYRFDLVCQTAKSVVFVKFIGSEEPVTPRILNEMKGKAVEYNEGSKRVEIIAVSRAPYTQYAIDFAGQCDDRKSDAVFDLVSEKDSGYCAVHIGERKRR